MLAIGRFALVLCMLVCIAFGFWRISQAHAQRTVFLPYESLEYCGKTMDPGCRRALTRDDLAYVNLAVTEAMATVENEAVDDPWVPFPRDAGGKVVGDCDDQVVTERQILIALGIEPTAMHFEIGRVVEPDGRTVGHIVLVVALAESGVTRQWVLDRRTPDRLYQASAPRPYAWTHVATEDRAGVVWKVK